MRLHFILPILFLSLILTQTACGTGSDIPPDFRNKVQSKYQDLMDEFGEYDPDNPDASTWTYTYHPMIYAAWVCRGGDVSAGLDSRLREGLDVFSLLNDEISSQSDEGITQLDEGRFLSLIDEDPVREATSELIDEGIPALYAFPRAFVTVSWPELTDEPENILMLLGSLYTDRPELCELLVAAPVPDDDSKWRDWLHLILAAMGEPGIRAVLDWDRTLESLQELVPDQDFWEGRLTHAYTLRPITLAAGEAFSLLVEELGDPEPGEDISGFHKWIYWNLGWGAYKTDAMFPYSEDQVTGIYDLLSEGFLQGEIGENRKGTVIADSLGHASSVPFADLLFDLIKAGDLQCEREQLAYFTLGYMFYTPLSGWIDSYGEADRLRIRSMDTLQRGGLDCGNLEVLELYAGALKAFSPQECEFPEIAFTDEEMVTIHDAFINLLPDLVTADERSNALDLLLWALTQPEFMMRHPELTHYREILMGIHDDWIESTTFEGSEISGEDFERLLRLLNNTFGSESMWENE